ncbi:formyltransferase family protein [Spongiactinospora sp. TRM90649]|uniref:methionyl-tRNA formyltransferase n=1 Tax=Spongiactinospora sp. TRM90649 TaxID=3031114 RepID=UPI0023F8FB94|nr:formyltransferase family protein [Spongiactinospora sp. TRM90649]MDF5753638.1 formyltransferase family protein [Spongiactinospora sp. TRM90649]
MPDPMRIALASFGVEEFALLHAACADFGHIPAAYVYCRSMKPNSITDTHATAAISDIVEALPPGMDLLLPGNPEGLAHELAGYDLDLLIVYGFNWKLPAAVLDTPRLGVINVHTSLLPKYRGPAPVLWAIRNGDTEVGITIHRMDERFDAGPILAQRGGIPLEDDVAPRPLWELIRPVLADLLASAIDQVARHVPGTAQDEASASAAGFIEPEFSVVDWSRSAREVHNQVRMFAFMGRDQAPMARVGDKQLRVFRTCLEPTDGIRVECADAPIWIVDSEAVKSP